MLLNNLIKLSFAPYSATFWRSIASKIRRVCQIFRRLIKAITGFLPVETVNYNNL